MKISSGNWQKVLFYILTITECCVQFVVSSVCLFATIISLLSHLFMLFYAICDTQWIKSNFPC